MKPRMFVGSSVANLKWAHLLQKELEHDAADVTVWPQGVFSSMDYPLDSLLAQLDLSDFGAFICSPEDLVGAGTKQKIAVRDNVIFELGLYIGRLGKERSFVLVPDTAPDSFLPTDLLGLTPLKFKASNGAKQSSIGSPCTDIRSAFEELGPKLSKTIEPETLEQLAVAVDDLRALLDNDQFLCLKDAERMRVAYERAHDHAQTIVEREWPHQSVVVSLKTPDPDRPKEWLDCHYLRHRLPPRRLEMSRLTPVPNSIPIKKSIAGAAFSQGKPIYVERLEDLDNKIPMSKELRKQIDGIVGSVVACPLLLRGVVVGVVKFDTEIPGFFREKDRRIEAILRAVVACFELAFKIGAVGNERLWSKQRQNLPPKNKRQPLRSGK